MLIYICKSDDNDDDNDDDDDDDYEEREKVWISKQNITIA